MCDFAGYKMPIEYSNMGIAASHRHTRKSCSIFDVSHMMQSQVFGKDRIKFIESLTVGDIQGLKDGQASLSLFTNDEGGIEDDLIVTKSDADQSLFLVTNAGRRDNDYKLLKEKEQELKRYVIQSTPLNMDISSSRI